MFCRKDEIEVLGMSQSLHRRNGQLLRVRPVAGRSELEQRVQFHTTP